MDDCGIKYVRRKHVEHLHQILEETYEITTDWGEKYVGLALDCNNKEVYLSMPGMYKMH